MRSTRVCLALSCSFLLVGLAAHAQSSRKPGLYEVTTVMSFGDASAPAGSQMPSGSQMPPNSQMPQGMQAPGAHMPPGMNMPQMPSSANPMGGPRTTQVCVTQAMIDKYGGPNPTPPRGDCQITDVNLKPNGMKAKISCTGAMTATGTVESSWKSDSSSKSTTHIAGNMEMGNNSRPIDITIQASSVFKGSDCGSVQPMTAPAAK
jgi:hypothetical protein